MAAPRFLPLLGDIVMRSGTHALPRYAGSMPTPVSRTVCDTRPAYLQLSRRGGETALLRDGVK